MSMYDSIWHDPPAHLTLSENDVHAWRASLQQPVSIIQHLYQYLSMDEVTIARRFYFEKDRNHFIVARGLLRVLLGRYLDMEPGQLIFRYNPHGKPALDTSTHEKTLQFNLSHSHELALYAFTSTRHIGIDIEYMRSNVAFAGVARHSFSPNEQALFRALPEEIQPQAFYNCWTRKEAYIKARGKGLSIPLHLFDVSLQPGEPATLLSSREDPQEPQRWSMRELLPGPGYAGALAVEGSGWNLSCWQWSSPLL
jgi:4'-phosphopantetheinyl transferase